MSHTCHLRVTDPCPKCGGTYATSRAGAIKVDHEGTHVSLGRYKNKRELSTKVDRYLDKMNRDEPGRGWVAAKHPVKDY